jgi:type I restriction enzyme R subunit
VETRFTCLLDPDPRSRNVFGFHRPETLVEWVKLAGGSGAGIGADDPAHANVTSMHGPGSARTESSRRAAEDRGKYDIGAATLAGRFRLLPETIDDPKLWPKQGEAIANLERSLKQNRPRALIQMATGSGKTFTAISAIYRMIRHADARRVLFLVDRANLGRQTFNEF